MVLCSVNRPQAHLCAPVPSFFRPFQERRSDGDASEGHWFAPSTSPEWRASQLPTRRWNVRFQISPEGSSSHDSSRHPLSSNFTRPEIGVSDFARLDLGRRPPWIRASSDQVPSTTNVFPAGAFRTPHPASEVRNAFRDLATPPSLPRTHEGATLTVEFRPSHVRSGRFPFRRLPGCVAAPQ